MQNREIIDNYQDWAKGREAQRDFLVRQVVELKEKMGELRKFVEVCTKARWVLSEVTRLTQEKVKGYIENLTTMAIQAVFDREYRFVADFKIARNKSECYFSVKEGVNEYVPKEEQGGGIIDVISFALRVVLWSLEKPRSRNVLILDEPFRFLGKLQEKAGQMVKEVAEKLGIQIIMITHDFELSEIADKSFFVEQKNGISKVVVVGEETKNMARLKRRKR